MANYRDWIDSTLEKWGSAPARWINKEMIFVDENEKKLKAEMKPKERKSAKKCSDLPFFVNFDGDGLCGSSKMPDGRCINNGSYTLADAEALCSDIGTRLCTYQEITARQAQGSGCGLDSRYVWTSSTCGDGMNIMSHGGKGDDPLCKAPKEMSNGVRCCAEV